MAVYHVFVAVRVDFGKENTFNCCMICLWKKKFFLAVSLSLKSKKLFCSGVICLWKAKMLSLQYDRF